MQYCRNAHGNTKMIALLFIAALTTCCQLLQAQTEKYIQSLTGNINKGDSCVVTDDKFKEPEKWATIEKHLSVNNLITFELRYDTMANYFNRKFNCTLQFDIEYEKADKSRQQVKNISLELNFDTARGSLHQGIAFYKFRDAHTVKITVTKISSTEWGNQLPPIFRIKNEIFIERLYTLNTNDPVQTVAVMNSEARLPLVKKNAGIAVNNANKDDIPGQQQTISWDAGAPGFPQYDFEWTFYDDNSLTGSKINSGNFTFSTDELKEAFQHNSSRITVSLPFYQLNIIYNRGWVFHRVRGVRYDETTGERTEGAWSYAGSYNYQGALFGLLRSQGHEENLNWQYSRFFEEDGKQKEEVNYFDGNLRNRQSVTLSNDNAGSRSIVQENIFDALGRIAVNVLPAPTEDNSIHYFHSFNKSTATGSSYSYTDIESPNKCSQEPSAMSTASGVSQYYSPFNPKTDDNTQLYHFTKYIPDAKGYPFTVTRFTPDNTGRIRIQGGLGMVFQPGKTDPADDHTARYFYGKPQQEELDKLFGNEAGDASHYLKNMIIDANGQASVTYINSAGKTVATALAGKSPGNLQSLPSYRLKNNSFVSSLTDQESIVRDPAHLSLTCSSTFLATATGTFTLEYEFTPVSLQTLYGIQNEKICADCYYDLQLTVTDNCGAAIQVLNQPAVFTEKTTCNPAPSKQQGSLPVTIQQPGEYHITYQLMLSRQAIDYYVNQYLVQDLSIKKEVDFQREYLHKMNISGCFNDCATCLADLGNEQDFISRITILQKDNGIAAADSDVNWMKSLYKQLLEECKSLQQGCGQTTLPCEEETLQLQEDVTPGGQYMLYNAATGRFTERDINVFLRNLDALTTPVTINGLTKPFNQFNETEILANWQSDWANILLPWHPENNKNCFIEDCGKNAASDLYDKLFLNTEEAALAIGRHYWFGDDIVSVVDHDPYFATGAEGASKRTTFLSALKNYKGTGTDIMSFVRWSIYCQQKTGNSNYPIQVAACPRSAACSRQEDEWSLFKVLYYSLKQEVKDKNSVCNTADLFLDPLAVMPPFNQQPVICPAAALFQLQINDGTLSVQYTGAQPITAEVTVAFFAVDNNNRLLPDAAGSVTFPAGATAGAIKTIPVKEGLIYVINFARCDPGHPYYTKTRRNYSGLNLSFITDGLQNKPKDKLDANAIAIETKECEESCEQNADGWMHKLEGCNLAVNSDEYNQIRTGLIAVCKGSCGFAVQEHPFGASGTSDVTIYGDLDFKDVLLRVIGQQRFSGVCNDLLLDYPAPLGIKPLYTNEVVRTLSTCAYEKLQAWKAAYQSGAGYSSFTDYIKRKIDPVFSLSDAELNSLLGAYENNCVTPKPVVLPAVLSCNVLQPKTCLSCTELQDEKLNFGAAYNYVNPDEPGYYELLAKYINRAYTFNLSSVDIYNALQQCTQQGTIPFTDTVDCAGFTTAYHHFERLKPGYFTNPNSTVNADSLYRIHLTLWLNTELNRHLDFRFYDILAARCNVLFDYPVKGTLPACDIFISSGCAPQFITCCEPFSALDNFKKVFPDTINARLLALYFSLQRTQWCTPLNLPSVDYNLPYDSIVQYFNRFKLASNYTVTVRPDSLLSYTVDYSGNCGVSALLLKPVADTNAAASLYAVCNKPLEPFLARDDNSCINQQISVAMGNAHNDYADYITTLKHDYREAYYTKCLSITPGLTLKAVYDQPLEYHYALYYYDQSGNLVKTIPPAGVQPVDEGTSGEENMKRIKNFRLSDRDDCYEYGDAPAMNNNSSIAVADNPVIRQNNSPFTLEAFINFNDLLGEQTIISKQSINATDNKVDGYKIYLHNGRLSVDISAHGKELWIQELNKIIPFTWPPPYTNQPPVTIRSKVDVEVPRLLYRSLTAQITSDISDVVNAGQWVHIAIENTGEWNNPVKIFINGNIVSSRLITNNYDYIPVQAPALTNNEVAAGTILSGFAYHATLIPMTVNNNSAADLVIGDAATSINGSIKQVRLYNRALPAAEIRTNAFNACLVPQSKGQLVLWLPLNKEETAGTSLDRINQFSTVNSHTVFSTEYQPVYPGHKMPSQYYYNSLNAVTSQSGPDAGTTDFYFDLLGRLLASQNTEQKISRRGEQDNRYTYNRYDALGRIIETGEKTQAAAITTAIAKTDPTAAGSPVNQWLASGTDTQVTQTIYDQPDATVVTNTVITGNQNLYHTSRKRIVASIYRQTLTGPEDYNNATHYQYDISGNIKRLWQEHKKSSNGEVVNMLKDLQYDYDLVSGKIKHIIYQQTKGDQFVYKYEYDPDNRLLRTYSGRDMNTLQQDAGYHYYLHGPPARIELGDALTSRIVQGFDYTYTLQGWLRGVNGTHLSANKNISADAGNDGSPLTAAGIHAQVAADALAYTIGYYNNDYIPIGGSASTAFNIQYQHPSINENVVHGNALYNGNISNATYSILGIDNGKPQGYTYGYDQLNRLMEMRAHAFPEAASQWNNSTTREDHSESYTYDANGNINTLLRNGTSAGTRNLAMDNLAYHYYYYTLNNSRKTYISGQSIPSDAWMLTNQLAHIKDQVPDVNYTPAGFAHEKDIDSQADDNYTYDGIGNLLKDNAEGITHIGWTVYGKIYSIDKADGTHILYDYDAAGNRIQKQVIANGNKTISYYIRDARGNTIAVYGWQGNAVAVPVAAAAGNGVAGQTWNEQHLYGSTRLGMWKPGIPVPVIFNTTTDAIQVGSKFFELTNHLGNVLAVISDKKISVPAAANPSLTDHYIADVISAQDYAPFGMPLPGRSFSVSSPAYRYGFNGKENDNEVKDYGGQQDYGMRIYDPRVCRFLSVDPVTAGYPMLSPYQFGSNSPVSGIDLDGLEYSPAGKVGIFAVDKTAVQLYPDNPEIIQQLKADAPMEHLRHQVAHGHHQVAYFSTQWQPKNEFERERHDINKMAWYDRDGYKEDGTPNVATRLATNKTWTAFANNLALPFLDLASYADGEGEILTLLERASKNATRENITSLVDALFSSSETIRALDTKAVVGYRGSLATGVKFKTGGPFNPLDFDVDAFIVSDKLAKGFKKYSSFRNGRAIEEIKGLSINLETTFKKLPGYRRDKLKPFTFRIYTSKEFESVVKPNGYKIF